MIYHDSCRVCQEGIIYSPFVTLTDAFEPTQCISCLERHVLDLYNRTHILNTVIAHHARQYAEYGTFTNLPDIFEALPAWKLLRYLPAHKLQEMIEEEIGDVSK